MFWFGEITDKSDAIFKITPLILFLINSFPKILLHNNYPVKPTAHSFSQFFEEKYSNLEFLILLVSFLNLGSIAALLIKTSIIIFFF